MLELTGGEWFVTAFIVGAVVTAKRWPRVGAWLALRIFRSSPPAVDCSSKPKVP